MSPDRIGPEEQYRRLRDPDRWVGITAPAMPATRRGSAGAPARRGALVVAQIAIAAVVVLVATAVLITTSATRTPPAAPETSSIGSVLRSVTVQGDARPSRIAVAAGEDALYVAAPTTATTDDDWIISRIDAETGAITRITTFLPGLHRLAVGPAGLYVSTSTDPAHWNASSGTLPRDTIERLDLSTLRTLAATALPTGSVFDSDVALVAGGAVLVETDSSGAVRLLDPFLLGVQKDEHLLTDAEVAAGDSVQHPVLEDPTSDGGRIWVTTRGRFVALDLATLTKKVSVPQQGYGVVVATADGSRVLGDHVGSLADDGTITPDAAQGVVDHDHPVVAAAVSDEGVLEQVNGGPSPNVLLQTGAEPATQHLDLTRSGALLAASGSDAWFVGIPGAGSAISEVRITGSGSVGPAAGAQRDPGSVVVTTVTAENVRPLKVGVDITPVPAGTSPTASAAQAYATCDGGAVCGAGMPRRFVLALVSTREGLSNRLAYVMQWTGEYCVPTGPPATPGHTSAPVHLTPCNLVAVVDANTGAPLFSQSGPG